MIRLGQGYGNVNFGEFETPLEAARFLGHLFTGSKVTFEAVRPSWYSDEETGYSFLVVGKGKHQSFFATNLDSWHHKRIAAEFGDKPGNTLVPGIIRSGSN